MKGNLMPLVIVLVLSHGLGQPEAQAGPVRKKVAVKAGTILPIAKPAVQNGIILIEDGRITAVGKELEIPWDAQVMEATNRVVMPGFVLAHTFEGMDTPNENVPEVPFLSTFDSINPLSPFFEDALRDGIVAMLVLPGNNTLLGGTGTIVKPYGHTVEAMLVRRYTGLKISLKPRPGTNRMGHWQRLRQYLVDLREYLKDYEQRRADAAEEKKPFEEELDPRRVPVRDLLERRLKAFIYCDQAADVLQAIQLHQTNRLDSVLVLGPECYKAARVIAQANLPVILDSQLIVWETNEATHQEEQRVQTRIFREAKVPFTFQIDSAQYGRRHLWFAAATAVKHGLPRDEALKSITLFPAQLLGIEDRFGSIEPGKEAHLLFLTGDPLDAQTWVDQVMIGGEIVYQRDRDTRLKELLNQPKPKPQDAPEKSPPSGAGEPSAASSFTE